MQWLELACGHLNFEQEKLGGRARDPETVWMRDLVGLVGIDRYGVKVTELADVLGKSRDGVSRWFRRGAARRETGPGFASAVEDLDRAATEDP